MDRISKDDAFDVSDSTDWLETPLSSLAAVDSALRCQVCKDFYTTPMITSCSHTFCSLCIRRCLNNDGRCPVCRAEDQAMKLRNNLLVGELVEAFKDARPKVLEHARTPPVPSGPVSPKRKYVEDPDSSPPRKRTRSSGRAQSAQQETVVIDSDINDDDFIPDDGLVECPICQGRMTVTQVGTHIDNCTGEPPRSSRGAQSHRGILPNPIKPKSPVKHVERLPQVNYSMLKDQSLRKKLTDQGLSAGGSRQLLERRYTEWVILWNANCDAPKPRAQCELRRELEVWERTQGGRAPMNNGPSSGIQIKDKDFDGAAWISRHNDSFQKLIAQAKQKRNNPSAAEAQSKQPVMSEEQFHHEERLRGMGSDSAEETTRGQSNGEVRGGEFYDEDRVNLLSVEHLGKGESHFEPSESHERFVEEHGDEVDPTTLAAKRTPQRYQNANGGEIAMSVDMVSRALQP